MLETETNTSFLSSRARAMGEIYSQVFRAI